VRSFFVIFLAVLSVCGCESDAPKPAPMQPLLFESKTAPYRLELGEPWALTDSKNLNSHADLAATYNSSLYLIVIPQKLPSIPGVESPDALALKRASLAVLEERLKGFTIERQGPIKLDNAIGQSVFASGQTEGQSIQYVATYMTRADWGFQVVGWGPVEKGPLLTAEMDRILATWKFTGATPVVTPSPPEPEEEIDASSD
jgi:hypothetical protein